MLPQIKRRDVFLVLGFIFLLFAAVAVLTTPAFFDFYDLTSKGSIGDAINGLTAPFIGTFGAILVYLSFREQQRANEIQFKALQAQRTIDFIFKSYEELKSDLSKIQSEYGIKYGQNSMLDAFMMQLYRDVEEKTNYPELLEYLRYVNAQLFHLAGMLIGSHNVLGSDDSHLLLSKVRFLYGLYFRKYYDHIMLTEWKSSLAKNYKEDISLVWNQMKHVDQNIAYILEQDMKALRNMKPKKKKPTRE